MLFRGNQSLSTKGRIFEYGMEATAIKFTATNDPSQTYRRKRSNKKNYVFTNKIKGRREGIQKVMYRKYMSGWTKKEQCKPIQATRGRK